MKHILKAKHYVRYVDDFIISHSSKERLKLWRMEITSFLKGKLKLELHPDKSRVTSLSRGIDFVGFRNFYYFKLLRKRNIRKMRSKIILFKNSGISYDKLMESYQGWQAYAKWANIHKLRRNIVRAIYKAKYLKDRNKRKLY